MLQIDFLGSGSRGNATLIRHGQTALLLDCGFAGVELSRRLEPTGVGLAGLTAVLISHEHRDHVLGLPALARTPGLAICCTERTARALPWGRRAKAERVGLTPGQPTKLGAIEVLPFRTSHDAVDPVAFSFRLPDGTRLGVVTDLGQLYPEGLEALAGVDLLGLECNHDMEMLSAGPYPWVLKQRIRSPRGHLSNVAAADLLERLLSDRLRQVFALHLSETNNRPALVQALLTERLARCGRPVPVAIARQDQPIAYPATGQLSLF